MSVIYGLVALGLDIVLNATGTVNFAQGELSIFGGMLGASIFSRPTFRLQPPAARFAPCGG